METHYKFVVSSAEEAVKVIRERLGEQAHVISVRQVEGSGLARFLRAPKLEVIAVVGAEPAAAETASEPQSAAPVAASGPGRVHAPFSRPNSAALTPSVEPLSRLLLCAGISEPLLAQLRSREEWPSLCRSSLREALGEIAFWLRTEHQKGTPKPLLQCAAFIGTPGSGKTTALCKRLAKEVFIKKRRAVVLKLDLDKANPGDGLAVFCDVLGVPLIRRIADIPQLAPDETLFVDFPGINAKSRSDIAEMSHLLETLPPCSRVLVINAAYEPALMKDACRMGAALSASHAIFTHLDELHHWGKLWDFILDPALTTLFFSTGQNIAGDLNEAVFDAVLDHSFRLVGKKNATQPGSV